MWHRHTEIWKSFLEPLERYNSPNTESRHMSHAHIRASKAPPQPIKPQYLFWICATLFLLSVCTVFFWSNFNASQFWDRHATADGMIVETRVVIDRVADYRYGGAILYRLDAHVKFKADGQDQDRWLRVQTGTTSRLELMTKAATDPKTCLVYWTPGHLENARCKMDLY